MNQTTNPRPRATPSRSRRPTARLTRWGGAAPSGPSACTDEPPLSTRLVDATLADLADVVAGQLAAFFETDAKAENRTDFLVDRTEAAKFLGISRAQLDKLIREVGVPFHWVGDVKRFDRAELRAWLMSRRRPDGIKPQEDPRR